MAIFTDPIREHAGFEPGDAEWLHLLVGDWQMVADLAFADLALWFPLDGGGFVALAHARPSTSHTVFHSDFVGERIRADLQPLVEVAWESQKIERSSETNWTTEMAMRVEAVRWSVMAGPSPSSPPTWISRVPGCRPGSS